MSTYRSSVPGSAEPLASEPLNSDQSVNDQCVHDLVQAQASATPDAIALVHGHKRVSYREMNSRANRLAHRLRSLGVRSGVPVALCMERSIKLVIAALGVLKAGGAYVPLDPTYPCQRLSMLLDDSGTSLVVTQSSVASKLPAGKLQTIVVDAEEEDSHESRAFDDAEIQSEFRSIRSSKPHDLAYIIFTSGSTGRPKGVKISQGNLLNLIRWHQRAFAVTASDRATLQASPGFDAAVWEMWPYLAVGASLHVVDETVRATPDTLRDWMVDSGITVSFLPTVLAENMIGLRWPSKCALRLMLTGADTLRRRPPHDLPFALINNYGPTECTVVATSGRILPQGSNEPPAGLPSIGKPIDNVKVYIVDEQLQQVPNGATGELLIGGQSVGQGYLNAAEQTAASFLPDLFSREEGARLYKTGDMGRFLPNGEIAYLGRLDDQIKIMGHRVEPNEIVAVLNRHPGIETSHVGSYADSSCSKRLVAYLVPKADVKPGELRNFLGTYLPSYMVPAAFVRLTNLPLSAHGKLDRAALPQPTSENLMRDDLPPDSHDQPLSPIEENLVGLLSRLLAVPSVGRDDNFFTLGGHSLLGAQLLAKIRESFGVELTLRNLFEEPTVRGMSNEIERRIHARLAAMSDEEAERLLASAEGI